MRILAVVPLLAAFYAEAAAQSVSLVSWNVEGCDPAALRDFVGSVKCDIIGLCSLGGHDAGADLRVDADRAWQARGGESAFDAVTGATGSDGRTAVLFNGETLEMQAHEELAYVAIGGETPAPLVVRFSVRKTGKQFIFVMSHLNAQHAEIRRAQAYLLNDWARRQDLPIIAAGDFSFGWAVKTGISEHDAAYDTLVGSDRFEWVRPVKLIATRSDGTPAVHDFVFVSGPAREWYATSTLLEPPAQAKLPEGMKHRPVEARFELDLKRDPVERTIAPLSKDVQRDLSDLERAVRELPEASRKPMEELVTRLRRHLEDSQRGK